MASFLPVTLVGDNLGQRHRHLNSLVREAKESRALIQNVEALSEDSAVDRLFKIDLARELKHVDFIISNLKDDDMLYVSRALKATWLIDYRDIINPKYLEDILFPEMITPAVTKMKHWLYINLRDPAMCQEFYQHYKKNTFEFAIKFLSQCSHEFILEEAPKILTKLTTHSLKVLCEKCPKVAKVYFESLATDEDVKTRYLGQDRSYYNSVKCVLKSDADVFLDITEKYFNMNSFSRFSPLATAYIVRCHKTRFINKLELYVAFFLHIPTLAAWLSVDECQEVVIKLARASYLQHWFEYKVVEPLIKRLSPDKRAAFKKRVFVEKDFGDSVDKWPYEIPAPPVPSDTGPHIFDDQDFMPGISPIYPPRSPGGCVLFGAAASICAVQPQSLNHLSMIRMKTDLDRLFDEFRFIGFERALHELGQRLVATASPDRRRDIFIVLVSKTGGRTDAVSALMRLAAKHSNEPPHTRAAILRSLVKRAKVWRLPADDWQHLLEYGHGLGLDGTRAEAACREGLHAVVIRQLLAGECEQAISDVFMNDFSTLVEYSLKVDERARVANGLQNMLAAAATDVASEVAANRLWQLLDVLKIYRVRIEPTSPAVKAVMALALRDADVARPLLERLYNEKIARRELLRLNMEFRRDEAALLNALRHDPSLLDPTRVADTIPNWNCRRRNFRRFKPRPIVSRSFAAQPKNFGTSAVTTAYRFDSSVAPATGFRLGSSTSPPTDVSSSAAPPTGFRFDSSAVPPNNLPFGSSTAQTFFLGSSATPLTDVASSTIPTTDISFSHSSPTGFRFGSSSTAPTVVGSSTVPTTDIGFSHSSPTGLRFGSSSTAPTVVGSSTVPTTDIGFSHSSPTGFRFGSSSTAPTVVGSSTVPTTDIGFSHSSPTGFRFGSSSTAPTVVGSSTVPTTDIGFSHSSPTGLRFGSSSTAPTVVGSSTVPTTDIGFSHSSPTGFRFGSSSTAPTVVDSSTVPTTDIGFSHSSPTGFRFGSSSTAPTVVGSSTVPTTDIGFSHSSPTGLRFGSSSTAPTVVGSSTVPTTDIGFSHSSPTGLRFGSSGTSLTDVGGSAVPPAHAESSTVSSRGFLFDSSTTPQRNISTESPTDVGSSSAPPTSFSVGNSAPVTDGSAAAPTGFHFDDLAVQSIDDSSSTTLPTGIHLDSSAKQPTADSNSDVHPMSFSTSTDQLLVFGTSTAHSTVTGSIPHQPTLFGSSTARPMHFGIRTPQPMPFGISAPQPMHFGMPTPSTGFGRNPYHPTRFRMFGARHANFDNFISKLVIYFHQKQDFTTDLCTALKKKLAQGQNIELARPLASLFGNNFEKELHAFDAAGKESAKFVAALRACAHRSRPVVNLAEWGWRKAGVKAVATRAMRCREIERAALTRALAAEQRTVKVALAMSMRSASGLLLEVFASTAKLRPAVALRTALPYFRHHGVSSDLRVWDIVKPLISSVNLESHNRLRHLLCNTESIPSAIKADYCVTIYVALHKISFHNAQIVLRVLSKLLPECDESIETILLQMLDDDTDKDIIALSYPIIFVRYLLLSKNEEDVERRFMKIGNRFLERLDTLRSENDFYFQRRLSQILESLKYNAAFLDTKYTSCLSVIERILAWTQKFMPKEEYFEKYVQIHLTMMYLKAMRQSMKQMPEVFADPKRRKSEGVEAVGFVFGKYIAKEVAELMSTYFDSIIELFTDCFIKYLSGNLMYGSSRNVFIGFVLKGILTEAVGIQRRMAVYILREHQIVIEESVKNEIEELIMKDRALEFFAHAELFSHVVPVAPFYNRFK